MPEGVGCGVGFMTFDRSHALRPRRVVAVAIKKVGVPARGFPRIPQLRRAGRNGRSTIQVAPDRHTGRPDVAAGFLDRDRHDLDPSGVLGGAHKDTRLPDALGFFWAERDPPRLNHQEEHVGIQ